MSSVTGKEYCYILCVLFYVIECNKCKLQYVGETENALHIHVRMNGHWSDVKNRRLEKPVAKHFNLLNHSLEDLSVFIIKEIHSGNTGFHKAKESYLMQIL